MRVPYGARVTGVRLSLWRATTAFRIAAAAFCVVVILLVDDEYEHPAAGLAAGAVIVAVTIVIGYLGWTGRAQNLPVVLTDLAVTLALTLFTIYVQYDHQIHQQGGGLVTLTTVWAAGPVIGLGLVTGWIGGVSAGALAALVSLLVRGDWRDGHTLTNAVLLVIVGAVAGYVAALTTRAEAELAAATTQQAAMLERERLARQIHDGVLQVLGLVHRAGMSAGGNWAELGSAAGEQEAALRGLVTSGLGIEVDGGRTDLVSLLAGHRAGAVTVSVPGEPILIDSHRAGEIEAIVIAALQNVAQHAGPGAHAWVLLENLGDELAVTVRDDGVGMTSGRPAEAERAGRLGLSRSIRGRADDLGGRLTIHSAPGAGTELELVVSRTGLPRSTP